MNPVLAELGEVEPIVSERECGGWLATTPVDSGLRIGVTALTEGEARALFDRAIRNWIEALEVRKSA